VEFPLAAPSGIPQTSLGFRGHLITNFPHIMVLLIITGVLDVVQALLTTAKCIFSRLYSRLAFQALTGVFLAELIKIAWRVKALFYSFETILNSYKSKYRWLKNLCV
jgi:hypothetical protein